MEGLAQRLAAVREGIAQACRRAGRDPAGVRLLLASKQQSPAAVLSAHAAGQRDFGENYAQELRDKAAAAPVGGELRWHFIGPLQRNKVRLVVGTAVLIHTVDSVALCQAIAARAAQQGSRQDCLIEVNLGGEAQKGGCAEADLPALLEAFGGTGGAARCVGLMCIPPATEDPEGARPYFRRLRELSEGAPFIGPCELSMGMSQDYAVAIEEGATIVRVGTAVFGPRH